MKISETKSITAVAAPAAKDAPPPSARPPQSGDRVTTGSAQELQRAVGEAETRASEAREARVAALTQAVEKGEYSVNASQVAERMLESADLGNALREIVRP